MTMDTNEQYKIKIFLAENAFSKIKQNEKRSEVQLQSQLILSQLFHSSYENNAYVDVKNFEKTYAVTPLFSSW